MTRSALAALLLGLAAAPAQATCRDVTFETIPITTCTVTAGQDLRLFLTDEEGQIYGSFGRIEAALQAEGKALVFAMNAGMFHADRAPVGLYVEDHQQQARIVTREGPGNFGMLPNGVFCIAEDRFSILESRAYADAPPDCRFATQSGPLMVIDGDLHPRFLPDSDSLHLRNGVGVSDDGQTAYFAISDQPISFHQFARFFRDELGVNWALYLDGSVSRLYAPELGRSDWGMSMGPVVGLVAPMD
ncbi:phosphodiester glycosidase family protein [Pararhodobacter zhoushanensis]|uniref:phosphodiester glycosidase family protein n=1 Tax=Pararhodobacter zhoushanensis TaxID=2479545 RepID=UPI000F8C8484|nr:phosphodiester glycosidase family protein [Pararhodobacter zhoushanensis]